MLALLLLYDGLFTFDVLVDGLFLVLLDELVVEFRLLFKFGGLGYSRAEHVTQHFFGFLFHFFEESVVSLFELLLLFLPQHP